MAPPKRHSLVTWKAATRHHGERFAVTLCTSPSIEEKSGDSYGPAMIRMVFFGTKYQGLTPLKAATSSIPLRFQGTPLGSWSAATAWVGVVWLPPSWQRRSCPRAVSPGLNIETLVSLGNRSHQLGICRNLVMLLMLWKKCTWVVQKSNSWLHWCRPGDFLYQSGFWILRWIMLNFIWCPVEIALRLMW